jgi:YegS/Rv2252/BmrU family lipid kinase
LKRALLIFNPRATRASARIRDVIIRALATELKLEVAGTKRRLHATHLAQGAVHEGIEQVIVLGGDGTLNEVINGLLGSDVVVTPLPGGGTNVFARTLGLPNDAIEATAEVLDRIQSGTEPRQINLGSVNGRAFAFNAGVGFDAAVVQAVERRYRMKKHIGEAFFVYQALRTFFFTSVNRHSGMTVTIGDEEFHARSVALICNSDPYTYWGRRALHVCPEATLEEGLDLTTFARFRAPLVVRSVLSAFGAGSHIGFKRVHARHDLASLTVRTDRMMPFQVDGDHAGEGTTFEFRSLPRALRVLA